MSDNKPNFESDDAIVPNTDDFEFSEATNSLISDALIQYGEDVPDQNLKPTEYKERHSNRLINNLTIIANLTNNTLLQVALCIDQSTITKYNLAAKNWELPPCQVSSNYTLQGALTKFAETQYNEKWIPQRKAKVIKEQKEQQEGKSTQSGENMALVLKSLEAIQYPHFGAKIKSVYGEIARYFVHFWYLHPKLTRQEAFAAAMKELKEKCLSRDGHRAIIKGHLDEQKQEHCEQQLLAVLDAAVDQTVIIGGNQTIQKAANDNGEFHKHLLAFFKFHGIKDQKALVPDPLLTFQHHLRLATTPAAMKQKFLGFTKLSPKRTDEYDNWIANAKAKLEKKKQTQQNKLEKEKTKRERDEVKAKAAEQKKKMKLQQQAEKAELNKEIHVNLLGLKKDDPALLALEVEKEKEVNFVTPQKGKGKDATAAVVDIDLILDMTKTTAIIQNNEDYPPTMLFDLEGNYQADQDDTPLFKAPGKEWKKAMGESYCAVLSLVDRLAFALDDIPLEAFQVEDDAMVGGLCETSGAVIQAIWNQNMVTTPIMVEGPSYDLKVFTKFVDQSHSSWLTPTTEAKVQASFAVFYYFVVGHNQNLVEKICAITNDTEQMLEKHGKHCRAIMVELLKVHEFIFGDALSWKDTDDTTVAACISNGLEA